MNLFFHLGRYFLLIKRVFSKPEKISVYVKQTVYEIDNIGIGSLPIISIISFFMGGVITIQAAFGFTSPIIPLYALGFTTRESMLLEFSPTIVCLILAGKIGSNIASEIGSMRITEQIVMSGPNLGMPYTKAMGHGLFEIRARGAEGIGRAFFCCMKDQKVVVLHSFVKKTQTTPQKELQIANKHMKEVYRD